MDKEAIIRNFSRYAYAYDRYANIQKCAALELLKLIKEDSIGKILEIGCGTGNYTLLLREKFNSAEVKAVDISGRMIEVASSKMKNKRIKFILEDAESINLDERFDIITSNACFQWFDDLGRALIKYKNLLNKKGIILFSIFGPDTFRELDISLKHIFRDMSVSASNFMALEEIKNILRNNFTKPQVKEVRYEESFSCLMGLLNKIKYTGIKGSGLNAKIVFTPGLLNKLEEIYLRKFSATDHAGSINNFGGKHIKATYQIFFCKASR